MAGFQLSTEAQWRSSIALAVAGSTSCLNPAMPATSTDVSRERLPHVAVGSRARVRLFPDDQPIAVTPTGRVVFTYVVAKADVEPLRAFI
jgi:hypothetical protein